jgi:hypothetical protein
VSLDGRAGCAAPKRARWPSRRSLPVLYAASVPSVRVVVRLPEARDPIKSVPRKVRPISVNGPVKPMHRPVPCVSIKRTIKSIPREVGSVGVGSIESVPREVRRVRIRSIKAVPREVRSVSARAAASVAEPAKADVTVGGGPTGVAEIRPTPTKPLSLSRSSRRNCETHAKDRQCCVLCSIQHGLISCGIHSAFELLVGQRRNGLNVCSSVVLQGLAGMTQLRWWGRLLWPRGGLAVPAGRALCVEAEFGTPLSMVVTGGYQFPVEF